MTRQRTQNNQTRQQSASINQVHADFASVESVDGVTFSSGNMMVNGVAQMPMEAQRWQSSNGLTVYTTVQWRDPGTEDKRVSCNCTGWAMKKGDKPRRCKHTDDMMGIKPCRARKVDTTVINTIRQAEDVVPKFDGRPLRGLMLD